MCVTPDKLFHIAAAPPCAWASLAVYAKLRCSAFIASISVAISHNTASMSDSACGRKLRGRSVLINVRSLRTASRQRHLESPSLAMRDFSMYWPGDSPRYNRALTAARGSTNVTLRHVGFKTEGEKQGFCMPKRFSWRGQKHAGDGLPEETISEQWRIPLSRIPPQFRNSSQKVAGLTMYISRPGTGSGL